MSYCKPTHLAQMSARSVNEELLMAQGADGTTRAYHQREAMRHFGELAAYMHELVMNTGPTTPKAEDGPILI